STRRMEKLVESLGITRLSRSQVSEMARDLDEQVEAFRTRPLDAGPYTFVAAGALVLKVREGGRLVNVHALLAAGVNADGHREIPGLQVTSAEDGAGWLAFFRDLTARGLTGVALVTSDAHRGLTEAIGATVPGASCQRCRTHYAANLMSVTPKASWPWVKTLLHSVYDQPDAASVHDQYDRLTSAIAGKLPKVAAHLDAARADVLAFTSAQVACCQARAEASARPPENCQPRFVLFMSVPAPSGCGQPSWESEAEVRGLGSRRSPGSSGRGVDVPREELLHHRENVAGSPRASANARDWKCCPHPVCSETMPDTAVLRPRVDRWSVPGGAFRRARTT
ncbi:MAG: putative transposase, partial [Streptosporangiaceae bacterium]|nr:putative transposase [Streptosporangiaceae bacterium]